MFVVPKTGRKPWLLVSVGVAAALVGLVAWQGLPTQSEADKVEAARAEMPVRPALEVVENLPRLKSRLDYMGQTGQFMGGILVARGNEILYRQVYGMANREAGQPLALDSRFLLASVSKQFTAVAVLKLQEAGKLSVDDPVCKWIQPCPERWQPLKIHHLLSHTSGIPDLMSQSEWGRIRITPRTLEELTAKSAEYGLQFQPGTKVRYNNAAFNLAADIVGKASGMPFEDYLRTEILDPLGMKDTGSDAKADAQGIIMGYANFPGGITPQPLANVSVVAGAGALYSTLDDMLVWNQALHKGRILESASYADMIRDHAPEGMPSERGLSRRAYGYGIYDNHLGERVSPAFDDRQIYHTGSWAGFRNLVVYQPDNDITVVVLSNNYHQRDQVFLLSQQALAEALGRDFPTGMKR